MNRLWRTFGRFPISFVSKLLPNMHTYSRMIANQEACADAQGVNKTYKQGDDKLNIFSDIISSIDPRHLSMLTWLALSVAFDTVDHDIPLSRIASAGHACERFCTCQSNCIGFQRSVRWFNAESGRGTFQTAVIYPVHGAAGGCREGTWLQPTRHHMRMTAMQVYTDCPRNDAAATAGRCMRLVFQVRSNKWNAAFRYKRYNVSLFNLSVWLHTLLRVGTKEL